MRLFLILTLGLSAFYPTLVLANCTSQSIQQSVIDYDWGFYSRPIGVQKEGMVLSFEMGGVVASADCTANSQVYITADNTNVSIGTLGGIYGIIENRTAFNLNSGYAFTVEEVSSGKAIPAFPSSLLATVANAGKYVTPKIRVRIYATNEEYTYTNGTAINAHNVTYIINDANKQPLENDRANVIYKYRIKGSIHPPGVYCQTESNGNLAFNLPRVSVNSFPEKGFSDDPSAIATDTLVLKCSGGTGSVYMKTNYSDFEQITFKSGSFDVTGSVFKTKGEGSDNNAKGIGVVIGVGADFYQILDATKNTFLTNAVTETKRIPLFAKYYRYGNEIAAGKISGAIDFTIEYK